MTDLEAKIKELEARVTLLELLYKNHIDTLPFSAELAFGKPVQHFKVRGATEAELNEKVLAKVAWVKTHLKLPLSGT